MTQGSLAVTESSAPGGFCACCGAKIMPYFSDDAVVSQNQIDRLISENFLTVKGAALFLPRGNGSSPSTVPRITHRWNKHTGDLQQHLQTMFTLLRPEDSIRLAVRLESAYPQYTRYMVVVSTSGRQDTEESVVLGLDFTSPDRPCTVGLVLPLWSDTLIHLDGDGGFSVSTANRVHIFKPVSVQAMWSALQSLHKACEVARGHNYYPGSLFLTWVSYYQSRISSEQHCINEWNAMQDVQSHRADSPVLFTDVPTERERTERLIKTRLREIMMQKDLENVTSKEIRTELEMQMVCNLREFKEFIDNEMIVILGQMDSPTEIFDHVFLGSEWNASNLEELQNSGVRYILNVTREIDNFFPGLFEYHNIRVYDEEATNLLENWNDTYKFISKAKKAGAKCLVHCKMGVSRSASTVIAYAMKEYGWDLGRAFEHVKERRTVTKPNPSFMKQLEEYQGILLASKQRHNKLWRSHSDSDLSERQEPLCKTTRTLGRSDPHNNHLKNGDRPSIQNMLAAVTHQSLNDPQPSTEDVPDVPPAHRSTTPNRPSAEGRLASEQVCEDPSLPPLPRPRAATVVPEQNMAESCSLKAAVTVPITRLHPLASLYMPPPSPSPSNHTLTSPLPPEHVREGPSSDPCTESCHAVPEPMPDSVELSLIMPDQTSSSSMSQSLALCLDTVSAISETRGGSTSPGTPIATSPLGASPALGHPSDSDLESCHNKKHTQTAASSANPSSAGLSTDSIDFFSARERFLELTQDGQGHSPAEHSIHSPSTSLCPEEADRVVAEEYSSHLESSCENVAPTTAVPHPSHHDNGVSVRHMVTELECISDATPPCPQPPAQSPQHRPSLQELEQGEEEEERHLLPPSPSPPCEWLPGSVRRATEQLELRLRQEQEGLSSRSPLASPCLDIPELLPASTPPGAAMNSPCTDPIQITEGRGEDARLLDDDDSGIIPDPSFCVCPEGSASAPTANLSLEPSSASSSLLWLEGVTELESDTDDLARLPGHVARSNEDLQKIQETLRELQAFLCEAGRVAAHVNGGWDRAEPEAPVELQAPAMWQRAMEIEARIRQAGLTPPSFMKRSASLAKLDQLELSMHDLNNWDFHPASRGLVQPSHTPSLPHCTDDAHKKQRVLPQSSSSSPPAMHLPETNRTEGSAHTSFSCLQHRQAGGAGTPEHISALPTVSTCTRQLHLKSHPVRRPRKAADKKKTVTVLYNTM
ncbi:hypothetical protein P4O66_017777 [Electrophorus voltai]|uniref:protein-serine/threonine phosphatase n=1 Tax=Electrophorus voltai TaxID=2609070 RepID=A0AAD9DKP9_9TELE|nr:hypothetical protein P4O66_017777 [Electrophorus voltai]